MVSGERDKVAVGVVEFLGDGCGVEDGGDTVVDRVVDRMEDGVEDEIGEVVIDGVEVIRGLVDIVVD